MTPGDATLPDDLDTAHRQIREQAEALRQQGHLIARLQHQLEQLLRQRYGRKGETVDPDQLSLFAHDIPARSEPMAPAPRSLRPRRRRSPRGHGRKPLPASLPRTRIVHDVAPGGRACPGCGDERRPFGEEVREQLEYVPAGLIVLQHVRPKYACANCAAHVAIAARLPESIEKGLPGTGLLAHVITGELADHLPLYRQEAIFRRHGVELARSTMCDRMAACAGLLEPIVKAMIRQVLGSKVIGTDDTPVTVQDHAGKGSKTGRLWAYLGDRDNPFVIYDYTPDRSRDGPERSLKDYPLGLPPVPMPMPDTTACIGGAWWRSGAGLMRGGSFTRPGPATPGAVARGDRPDRPPLWRGARRARRELGRCESDDSPL